MFTIRDLNTHGAQHLVPHGDDAAIVSPQQDEPLQPAEVIRIINFLC